jgi:hypothetical protein
MDNLKRVISMSRRVCIYRYPTIKKNTSHPVDLLDLEHFTLLVCGDDLNDLGSVQAIRMVRQPRDGQRSKVTEEFTIL